MCGSFRSNQDPSLCERRYMSSWVLRVDIRNRVEEEEDVYNETTQTKTETTSVEEKLEMRKSILQFVIGGVSALTLIILMQMEGLSVC